MILKSKLNKIKDLFSSKFNLVTTSKQKKNLFKLIVLTVGLVSGLVLVQRVQELREKALVGGPDLYFATSPLSVEPSNTGNVYDIYLPTSGFEVTAAVIEVQFDTSMIQITSISKGNALPDILVPGAVAGSTASITLGSGPSTPFTGTDKIATLTFTTVAQSGQTDITFTQNTQVAAIGHPNDVLGITSSGTVLVDTETLTTTPTNSPTPTILAGDINRDGVVNILDFQILSNNFGTSDPDSDLNGDGIVNILDFQIFSNNFG